MDGCGTVGCGLEAGADADFEGVDAVDAAVGAAGVGDDFA
jgi:hypothetical protein